MKISKMYNASTCNSMEHRLAEASDKDGEDKAVAEMRRKLQAAKLVSYCGFP